MKRTIHRIAESVTAETAAFLDEALRRDPNLDQEPRTLVLGSAGSWFAVVLVAPSYPSHPDDGVAWDIEVRTNGDPERERMTKDEAVSAVETSVIKMLGDLEDKLAWLRSRGFDQQEILNDVTVQEVMES